MPGLLLFRRRWAIASDDFVFPSIGEAFIRIAWLIALIIIYAAHQSGFNCTHGNSLESFYIGTLVLNSLGLTVVLITLRISMQGTIKDHWPRRNIGWCLKAKLFLLLPEAIWVCLSSYWVFGHSYSCDWSVVWTARGAVICSWIVGTIMFLGIVIVFDPLGSVAERHAIHCRTNHNGEDQIHMGDSMTSYKVWETRCRMLCCCISCNKDTREAFTDVGKLVADFFHDMDLVPSDIAAGLMLVQEHQIDPDAQLTSVVATDGQNPDLDQQITARENIQPKSWMTISNMAHYMKFAMGSYGWPFYVYENLTCGVCRLWKNCRCCACLRRTKGVFEDNFCHCNTAAVKKLAGVSDDDLIYVTFHNKFKRVPFYVAVDRAKNAVVISIRGTLSLSDALADLSATGASLEIPNVENSYCHAAMLDCARYIKAELESHQVLDTAFAQLQEGGGLVITGHSLGAGVAAILAVLLKPQFPSLVCYCFSPPGGLMSPSASKFTLDFIVSVVIGKDLIPRLGMYNLVDLKVKILRALCECNKPKYKILASGCLRLICCAGPSNTNESTSDRSLIRDRPGARYTEERAPILQDALRLGESQLEEVIRSEWPLHPAGQILHVIETDGEFSSSDSDIQYCAYWSKAEFLDRIVISHKMVSDHLPNTVGYALDQLAHRNYTPHRRQSSVQHHTVQRC